MESPCAIFWKGKDPLMWTKTIMFTEHKRRTSAHCLRNNVYIRGVVWLSLKEHAKNAILKNRTKFNRLLCYYFRRIRIIKVLCSQYTSATEKQRVFWTRQLFVRMSVLLCRHLWYNYLKTRPCRVIKKQNNTKK